MINSKQVKNHEKLVKSLGKRKAHKNRVERPVKDRVEKLPLYKTPRRRDSA